MKRFEAMLVAAGLCAASLPAFPVDMTQAARFGVATGRYQGELQVQPFDAGGNPIPLPPPLPEDGRTNNVKFTWGGELGYTMTVGDFYGDIGLNILRVQLQDVNNWRTDALLTFGYYITDNWSVFTGLRQGWQGDGVFKDDKFSDFGPYIGFGYGGIPLGGWGTLNTSFAYNFDKVKDIAETGIDLDYPGVSFKLGLNFKGTPNSIQLRLQRFSGDETERFDDGTRLDLELTETWAVLSYVFTLGW